MTNEVLCVLTDILPIPLVENDSCVGALFNEVLEVLATEWGVSAEKSVGNHAKRPHINRFAVTFLEHDFWCCITKRASHGCENFIF
jgi:hypothetical protein